MPTAWRPDPNVSSFELGWDGDYPTRERRRMTGNGVAAVENASQSSRVTRPAFPRWTKIAIPVDAVVVFGAVLSAVLLPRLAVHQPTEEDYRNALIGYSDGLASIAVGPHTQPEPYPTPLRDDLAKICPTFKTMLDNRCNILDRGCEGAQSQADLNVAVLLDQGKSLDAAITSDLAALRAAVTNICPLHESVGTSIETYLQVRQSLG